jgi:hypothetical protein
MRALMPLMFQVAIFMEFAALPQANAFVMPGLVPGIHEFLQLLRTRKTDGRDGPGHDGVEL